MQQKHLFQACSSLSFSFFVNLWMRPKGSLWKLIGKHITLTKAKILKISKTNKTVLRKFTNPLCLNASFSSWFSRSTAICYACQTEIGISGNTTLYQQAVTRSILRELDCQINMFWTQSLYHMSFNFWYVNLKFCMKNSYFHHLWTEKNMTAIRDHFSLQEDRNWIVNDLWKTSSDKQIVLRKWGTNKR